MPAHHPIYILSGRSMKTHLILFAFTLFSPIVLLAEMTFVTGQILSLERFNNTSDHVGFRFTNTSGSPIVITELGRWVLSGNNRTHELSIFSPAATPTRLTSVTINCSGAEAGKFLYGRLSTPYTLPIGASCYIVSSETQGGDYWLNNGGTNLTTTDIGQITAGRIGNKPIDVGDNGRSYGPVSFRYSSPAPNWTKSGTTYSTDGSIYSVNSALRDASPGDTISIPPGTFTWGTSGTSVSVTKPITLRGAGAGATTIQIAPSAPTWANATITVWAAATIRDFTISQSGAAPTTAISFGAINGWRATELVYNSASVSGYFVYAGSYGIIDQCIINGGAGSDEWIFTRGPTNSWQTSSTMGSSDAVYVEDCSLNIQGYADFNSNSRAVVRFCSINPSNGKYIKIDAHGMSTNTPPRSSRHIEIYGNVWTAPSQVAMEIRGGTGMIFNNIANFGGAIFLGDYEVVYGRATRANYPLVDQIGVGRDPKIAASEPLYLWNNKSANANWPALNAIWGTSMAGVVEPNRDYYDTAASFNGTSGVGRGSKSQMLALAPTKSNVAFWVTDEGEWNSMQTGPDGQLYIWTGSSWILKYTPFTYPHPSRTGGVATPVESLPNAPSQPNVRNP